MHVESRLNQTSKGGGQLGSLLDRRAAELATVAEVSTTVAAIHNPDEMLQTVVDMTSHAFQLYHTHVYLLNETSDELVLAKGSGEVGRKMVAEGNKIDLRSEKSLIAHAARVRQGVIENDLRHRPGCSPHPLLPETRSEMAVPMIATGRLLGVFGFHACTDHRFTAEDVSIMTTLATQVAVSLQSVWSYTRAQRQAEHEALINIISERIQATQTVESALQVTIREIGRALGASQASIRLHITRELDSQPAGRRGEGKG
jgi:GAF domain-containing protein